MAIQRNVRERLWLGSAFAACVGLGVVDSFIPREAAVGVLYTPIVVLAMLSRRRWGIIAIAALATGLTWLDYWVSPDGGSEVWAIFDRAAATVAIWSAAGLCAARIVAERSIERSLRVESLLRRELDERVRRNLAFLRAMISLEAGDPSRGRDQIVASLRARIKGMSEIHDLLAAQRWKPVALRELVSAVTPRAPEGQDEAPVRASGPETLIPPGQVGGLGAVLHELVLHSSRHGALSTPNGRLEIRWTVAFDARAGARRLELVWHESDAPGVRNYPGTTAAPELLEPFVREVLGGEIEFAYPSSGAFHRIVLLLRDEPDLYASTPPPMGGEECREYEGRRTARRLPASDGPEALPGMALGAA